MGVYRLLEEIANLARTEDDPKVRRYALASIRVAAEKVRKSGAVPASHVPASGGVAKVLSPTDPAAVGAEPVTFKQVPKKSA
jgi:hypothetical protein